VGFWGCSVLLEGIAGIGNRDSSLSYGLDCFFLVPSVIHLPLFLSILLLVVSLDQVCLSKPLRSR
jgi:hypothetical protein